MHTNLSSYVYGCLKRMYGDFHWLIYWHNRQYGGLCMLQNLVMSSPNCALSDI